MSQRRMFSRKIIASDDFLDMPQSSRELYFELGMYADDDGFVSPKKILRLCGASLDDLKILLAKRFLLTFDSGVIVIKHWLIHNSIRMDRYTETDYKAEKAQLGLNEWGAYTELSNGVPLKKFRQPNGNQMAPQVRLGKDRIGKVNTDTASPLPSSVDHIFTHWISKPSLQQHRSFTPDIKKALDKARKNYPDDDIVSAINNYAEVLAHPELYYWSHSWPMALFLSRKNGIIQFLNEAAPLTNFLKNKSQKTKPQSINPDDIDWEAKANV